MKMEVLRKTAEYFCLHSSPSAPPGSGGPRGLFV
jgi:hypothetical protein